MTTVYTTRAKILLLAPMIAWLTAFLLLPYFFIFIQSFLQSDAFGNVVYSFTAESYIKIFSNKLYYFTLFKTLAMSCLVAVLCVILSLPLAYFIAFKVQSESRKTMLYTLIVLPFWVSYIVRAYSWKIILGQFGILNGFLMYTGIVSEPLSFILYSDFATIICLVYIFTPFVAIPIYTAFEQIPKSLVEASKDLGAGSWTTFTRVIIPLALPGIISGATFALVLTMGDFLAPILLGGPNTLFISNIVQNLFGTSNDKPLGSALGIVVLALIVLVLEVSTYFEKKYSSFKSS
ncbi:MAG: ABC transporter permease [Candidatus Kapabacteria bacterium]|jgi:spermidine/putrescine transport system permease protein|nr:ABC transporter permease [Candidatus Kapabacteria bacterium]